MTPARWVAALVAAVATPTAVRLVVGAPHSSVWQAVVSVTGLVAAAALVCGAVLATQPAIVTRQVGAGGLLVMHRHLGMGAAVLVALHLGAVVAADPRNLVLLGPDAPPAARGGAAALLGVAALVALAGGHSRWRGPAWRVTHLAAASVAAAGLVVHVWLLGVASTPAVISLGAVAAAGFLLHTPATGR